MNHSLNDEERILTHSIASANLEEAIKKIKNKIKSIGDLSHITINEQFLIVDDLAKFPFGQHILINGGSNGFWTDYLISPLEYLSKDTVLNKCFLEIFFLFYSPAVLAQRELFRLSQKIAQNRLANGKKFASIPCGIMRDLLTLDFASVEEVSLIGMDIDPSALQQANYLAKKLGILNVFFEKKDAWKLNCRDEFDFINSIGLNVYESDRSKVIELYRQLHKALKKDGVLFTGVLTWPPYISPEKTDWNINKISKFVLHLEEIIHKNILNLKWLNFRTLKEIELDFIEAGFSKVEIYPDSLCVFPAVIATK